MESQIGKALFNFLSDQPVKNIKCISLLFSKPVIPENFQEHGLKFM
jgi:hypothetical protein